MGRAAMSLDTGLMKNFYVTESKYVQFRWEMFNAPNHVNLSGSRNRLGHGHIRPDPRGWRRAPDAIRAEVCVLDRIVEVGLERPALPLCGELSSSFSGGFCPGRPGRTGTPALPG